MNPPTGAQSGGFYIDVNENTKLNRLKSSRIKWRKRLRNTKTTSSHIIAAKLR